jgi:hypothetical protein
MKILFIDESGHHNLDPKKIDPKYPIFVLSGCIFDQKYYEGEVIEKFNKLKKDFFDSDAIILHTLEMTRPSKYKQARFAKLINANFRKEFYKALNNFLEEIKFKLISCIIKKSAHLEKYGASALDPYLLSFNFLLDEFINELKKDEKGKIIAEKRNDILDNQLELAWLNFKINGTEIAKGSEIKEKIEALYTTPKSSNEAGLQIADLVANPIGRYILNIKKNEPGHEVNYDILRKKLRTELVILPK